ncbi:isoleucine--tRNA ligase [Candidatus Atelocyanobacterium thalassae]|uniref:Isoleucine--tRNA ligase n=1 Tax=Atelocyanobacterium thalassa (isolate ALOHA) TaxID=1453429 RepID=D3EMU8_ATETH|nr:isoleucine--tRNA ligase [Candidatus Atelocyanobacterium thalassa]ADB94798.1 Isoleucyl-tRNA synthetase [Candidatus Atelocyanobacterium thalassa isolate ALOHA]MCH2543483.1 isoleucine--tRNA ligase [Candidatus Atelocyanobacterium sp. ALOHA_A2.5_9]
MTEQKNYKNTVNLPQTDFNMRANSVSKEPELQEFWIKNKVYKKLSEENPEELFILHDGPPYANGSLHMGHALNKILKDFINKYKLLQGHKISYIPGWDCHGLPIELKVLQSISSKERQNLNPLQLRYKARDFALKTQQEQAKSFQRLGVWGDWHNPYLTMLPEYEAAQIGVFWNMFNKGYIYRGLKPVHWSPSSQTALAEAELEYPEGHVSRSIYTAFSVTNASQEITGILKDFLSDLGVVIWTTTPWTIPANLAVAVNPVIKYSVVEQTTGVCKHKYLIVAEDLVDKLSQVFETSLKIRATFSGNLLENTIYRHSLFDRECKIVIGGDYINTSSGTGLVHTAPGHGQEDYLVGQKYGLEILSPVDNKGILTEEAGPFAGLNVLKDANEVIINRLKEEKVLIKEELYEHKYPYDWRTKKPTIFRATEQWFASVEGFRAHAISAIKNVNWIPSQGINRITSMVNDRSDWCISRQRSWGVPIPVFYDKETNEALLTEETVKNIQEIFARKGANAWWEMSIEKLLPEEYKQDHHRYRKGTDTMDVWFDSGSSWASVIKQQSKSKYPVDMYLEGSDQHRGWFQSSLLTSVAVNGIAPYKTVLTHGFVLDQQGRKMSKSLGNVINPDVIINGGNNKKKEPAYGADVLRLWVSSVDYSSDVLVGETILKQISDVYRKIRNTARFLLGNLHDFDPQKDTVSYEKLPELDRYMLNRIAEVSKEVTKAFETFHFSNFYQAIQNFCIVDLSNFYLDIAKDRLYISSPNSFRRRSCQTVLFLAIKNLSTMIAPVLSHMAEDIWQHSSCKLSYNSVFEGGWVDKIQELDQPELKTFWVNLRLIRNDINNVLELARQNKVIGSSLDAKIILHIKDVKFKQQLMKFDSQDTFLQGNCVDELRYFFLVSRVELIEDLDQIKSLKYQSESELFYIGVVKAEGEKCDRCWNYSTTVGDFIDDPTICDRCHSAISKKF